MTLLLMDLFIGLNDRFNAVDIRPDLGFWDGPGSLIARRLTVIPYFSQSLPVNAGVPLQLAKLNLLIADFTP
jgi:hypothetical protein